MSTQTATVARQDDSGSIDRSGYVSGYAENALATAKPSGGHSGKAVRFCFGDVCRTPQVLTGKMQLCRECREEANREWWRAMWAKRQMDPAHRERHRKKALRSYHATKNLAERRERERLKYRHDPVWRARKVARQAEYHARKQRAAKEAA